MITIHRAKTSDIEPIANLFNDYRIFYKQEDNLALAEKFLSDRITNNESIIFLARENNVAVGFTQLYKNFSSVSLQHSWILNDLFVEPSSRLKGIGEKLLSKAKDFAIDNGAKGLALETGKENPAQKLYERLGWVVDNDYLHYFWKASQST